MKTESTRQALIISVRQNKRKKSQHQYQERALAKENREIPKEQETKRKQETTASSQRLHINLTFTTTVTRVSSYTNLAQTSHQRKEANTRFWSNEKSLPLIFLLQNILHSTAKAIDLKYRSMSHLSSINSSGPLLPSGQNRKSSVELLKAFPSLASSSLSGFLKLYSSP